MDENKQDRLNEMAALESYFADDTTCLEYSDDDRGLRGYILVKIPKSHEPINLRASASVNEVYEVSVSYLPPVKMFFSLPDGYPSKSGPEYELIAQWWPRQFEHDVKERLNMLCDEFRPLPVLLSCVEAIKEQLLESILTQNNTIDMDVVASERGAERSSGSDRIGPNGLQLMLQMVSYDERRSVDEFDNEYFECPVCVTPKSGKGCARFVPCEHVFCKECLSEFYRQQLSHSVIKPLCCMATACSSEASPSLLRSLLSADQFDRYERLLFEKSLENMEDTVYCPRPSCQSVVVVTPTEESRPTRVLSKLAVCPMCDFSFCVKCGKAYHALAPCQMGDNIWPSTSEDSAKTDHEEFERRQKLLRAFERASDAERESMYRCLGGRRQLDRTLQQIMTERWMAENGGRNCPWCNTYILKDYGCDLMACINCGNSFCWRCGERLDGRNSVKHFGRSGYSCRGIRNAKQEHEPYL